MIGVVTGVSLASRSHGEQPAAVPPLLRAHRADAALLRERRTRLCRAGAAHAVTFAAVHDSATGGLLATVTRAHADRRQGGTEGPSDYRGGRRPDVRDHRTPSEPRARPQSNGQPNVFSNVTVLPAARGRQRPVGEAQRAASSPCLDISPATTWRCRRMAPSSPWTCSTATSRTCPYTGIRVVTLATGATVHLGHASNGAPFNVSWAGNEHLAFEWQDGNVKDRLLASRGPADRNLLAAQQIAPAATAPGPDGLAARDRFARARSPSRYGLAALSRRTGTSSSPRQSRTFRGRFGLRHRDSRESSSCPLAPASC